jgi:hypothetical protein
MIDSYCIKVTQFDPNDPMIAQFQTAVFGEHGLKFHKLSSVASRSHWDALTADLGRDVNDCYRSTEITPAQMPGNAAGIISKTSWISR